MAYSTAYPTYFTQMPPRQNPPPTGVKVLAKRVWDVIIYPQWLVHKKNANVPAPTLSPPSASGTYITDAESLQVCAQAMDFGLRLYLNRPSLQDISAWGCVMIYFEKGMLKPEVPDPSPPPPGAPAPAKGLTVGGAREWLIPQNVPLDGNMEAFAIEHSGNRWGPVEL